VTPSAAWSDLSERLGVSLFEIPILPPSVPGLRLYNVLRAAVENAGVRVTIGPAVRGWLPTSTMTGAPVLGVVAETAGGPRHYAASAVILATGGFAHGGLFAAGAGNAVESVFNLPVYADGEWFSPEYWSLHRHMLFGVAVNNDMQPVDAGGEPVYPNLWAVGGILAGADRIGEGCREGVDLATAWRAVSELTLPVLSPLPS
jgi:glycerol-3-phosphate dehydrogenase subunit B